MKLKGNIQNSTIEKLESSLRDKVRILSDPEWGSMKDSSLMLKSLVSRTGSYDCLSSNDNVVSGRGNISAGDNISSVITSDRISFVIQQVLIL